MREYLDATVSSDTLQQAGRVAYRDQSYDVPDLTPSIIQNTAKLMRERSVMISTLRDLDKEIRHRRRRAKAARANFLEAEELGMSISDARNELMAEQRALENILERKFEGERILQEMEARLAEEPILSLVRRMEGESAMTIDELTGRTSKRAQQTHRFDATHANAWDLTWPGQKLDSSAESDD